MQDYNSTKHYHAKMHALKTRKTEQIIIKWEWVSYILINLSIKIYSYPKYNEFKQSNTKTMKRTVIDFRMPTGLTW